MTQTLFLDTSGLVAAILEREDRHAEASELYRSILRSGGRLVTTNLVLAEAHALMVRRAGVRAALDLLDDFARDASHELVYATSELHKVATDRWLRPYRDHGFSLADAVSFEVMSRRRLRRALSLDRHFRIAGFETL